MHFIGDREGLVTERAFALPVPACWIRGATRAHRAILLWINGISCQIYTIYICICIRIVTYNEKGRIYLIGDLHLHLQKGLCIPSYPVFVFFSLWSISWKYDNALCSSSSSFKIASPFLSLPGGFTCTCRVDVYVDDPRDVRSFNLRKEFLGRTVSLRELGRHATMSQRAWWKPGTIRKGQPATKCTIRPCVLRLRTSCSKLEFRFVLSGNSCAIARQISTTWSVRIANSKIASRARIIRAEKHLLRERLDARHIVGLNRFVTWLF